MLQSGGSKESYDDACDVNTLVRGEDGLGREKRVFRFVCKSPKYCEYI